MRFVAVRVLLVLSIAAFVASIWLGDARAREPTPLGWYETGSHMWLCLGPDGKAAMFGEHTKPHLLVFGTWGLHREGHAVEIQWVVPEPISILVRWDPDEGRLGTELEAPPRWFPRKSPSWAKDVGPHGTAPMWATEPGSLEPFTGDPWWARVP